MRERESIEKVKEEVSSRVAKEEEEEEEEKEKEGGTSRTRA